LQQEAIRRKTEGEAYLKENGLKERRMSRRFTKTKRPLSPILEFSQKSADDYQPSNDESEKDEYLEAMEAIDNESCDDDVEDLQDELSDEEYRHSKRQKISHS
jgi:hypothetical protein